MATLFFEVFETASHVAAGDPIQQGTVAISGSSTSSAAIAGASKRNRIVRIMVDTAAHVTWGTSPTADTADMPMGAENPEYFHLVAGQQIAVIARTLP